MTLRSAIITGTANININGTVGATTPSTGSFTTLSSSGATTLASGGVTIPTQFGALAAPSTLTASQQVFNGAGVWTGQITIGGETDFGWNFYYNGGFKSRLADVASRLSFNATSGRVSFWTAPNPGSADAALTFTEALRIDATTGVTALGAMAVGNGLAVTGTGQVGTTLGVGGATPSASGAGITFPATQSASTDANTLDDYEEGTWTPTQGAGLTVVGTFSSIGRYTKIGDTVFIEGKISASTSLSFTSGAVCGGLPFSASSTYESMFSGANQNSNATAIVASSGTSLYAQSSMAATLSYYFSGTYKLS